MNMEERIEYARTHADGHGASSSPVALRRWYGSYILHFCEPAPNTQSANERLAMMNLQIRIRDLDERTLGEYVRFVQAETMFDDNPHFTPEQRDEMVKGARLWSFGRMSFDEYAEFLTIKLYADKYGIEIAEDEYKPRKGTQGTIHPYYIVAALLFAAAALMLLDVLT